MKSCFIIAAPHSGAGKTTVTLSILAALKARGLKVQSFKAGPDYIDPAHHSIITGRTSHNLDTWMLGEKVNHHIFQKHSVDADVCVVEGVMGLFDGIDGKSPEGSTAQLASQLGLPVVFVTDSRSMARSAAALVSGYVNFDPELLFAALIWNRVGSPTHRRILDEAALDAGLPRVIGAFGRSPEIAMAERHLGLVTPDDADLDPRWQAKLAAFAEESLDLDLLLRLTSDAGHTRPVLEALPSPRARIAIPQDRAFCFYYEENLDILRRNGAETVFFKPTEGDAIPEGVDGLYLGGGYPELNAGAISANTTFLEGIRELHARGAPIYAECGGFMVLCDSLETPEGKTYAMAGIFPARVKMRDKLVRLGYRRVEGVADGALAGMSARGHEFHYSNIEQMPGEFTSAWNAYNARGEELDAPGYTSGSAIGGYIHLHFGSNPQIARKLFGLE